jgi:hypothetical protein
MKLVIFAAFLTVFNSISAIGQQEYRGRDIDVVAEYRGRDSEYGGRAAERPGPDRGGAGGRGGNGNANQNGKNSNTASTNTVTSGRRTTISINGETFSVSPDTERRVKEFIDTYKSNGNVGNIVTAVAAFFSLFDLFSIEKSYSDLHARYKSGTFNPDEILAILSAGDTWSRAWRAQAVAFCEQEYGLAIQQSRFQDAKMWVRLRDIIANPTGYQNGGIKFDPAKKSVSIRSYPFDGFRSVAGMATPLSVNDAEPLRNLSNFLSKFPAARDFLIYADYVTWLNNDSLTTKPISKRDLMILNKAIISLHPAAKDYVRHFFNLYSNTQGMTQEFWSSMTQYTFSDYHKMQGLDSMEDQLGFFMLDVISNSDIVYGQYPSGPLLANNIPQGWLPQNLTPQHYTFWWSQPSR